MAPWTWRSKLLLVSVTLLATAGKAMALPAFTALKEQHRSSEGKLLDRHGDLLQELRLNAKGRALEWVPLANVSPALKAAVLGVEDKRFLEHGGVDFLAVAGAVWQNLSGDGRRGASTLTMQVVSFLEPGLRGKSRGLMEKVRQANLAWELEKTWTKQEILEAYLNLVTFRGEHQGVAAAARALFNKDPHALDDREAFLLASLLKAPGMNAAQVGDRLCVYAPEHPELGSCGALRQFAEETLEQPHGIRRRLSLAPHLAQKLLRGSGTAEVRSTIERSLQRLALELVREQMQVLKSQNVRDAAVVVLENRTGAVLAYVGGSGGFSAAPAVDMAEAERQAGSTLKPFLYGLAFEKGILRPQSWLLDEPMQVPVAGRGAYSPENYDHNFQGPVTVAQALGSSLNIPAVRTIELVGVEAFHSQLARLGFSGLRPAEDYGASLALGTADVTLLDLANAYRTLAREGLWSPLRFRGGQPLGTTKRAYSARAAREVSSVLASRDAREFTFGWESLLSTPYATAVKTGTSKDMRDNWCVGYSSDFTVAVWVGNSGGDPMWQVSGVSGAAPIWRGLMDYLHRGHPGRAFPALPPANTPFERGSFARILYPTAGSILAVDPDIPPGRQLVQLETEGEGTLELNGQRLNDALWAPVRGKYRLRLLGKKGEALDEVAFEVR